MLNLPSMGDADVEAELVKTTSDGTRRLKARCPWHGERTPSLSIVANPGGTRAEWKCFGCGLTGQALHLTGRDAPETWMLTPDPEVA